MAAKNPTTEPTYTGPTNHLQITKDRDAYSVNWSEIPDYRKYTNGQQADVLTDRQKKILEGVLGHKFCDNACHQVISEAADRLRLNSITSPHESVADFLKLMYTLLGVKSIQSDVNYNTMRDGNFVVAVNWKGDNTGRPKLHLENWWDGTCGVFIVYEEDEIQYAVKEWKTVDNKTRRLVWYPDFFERWILDGGVWKPYMLASDKGQWPVPWKASDGSPLGVPYVHFVNGSSTLNNYGRSELFGGVLGFQDQLTDAQYGISSALRLTAYQNYWATGVTPPEKSDPTAVGDDIELHAGSVWTSSNSEAAFGVLPAGSLDAVLAGYNAKLRRIAQITRTPLHSITGGDWPSGEAIMRAELPAVNKAHRQIAKFEVSWNTVMHMALKLTNRFGKTALPESPLEAPIITKYEAPELTDLMTRAIAVKEVGNSVSVREKLRILGYTDDQANKIYAELLEEDAQRQAALIKALDQNTAGTLA